MKKLRNSVLLLSLGSRLIWVCMSLSCPVKLRAAAVSFLSLLGCLLVLLKGAYADHFV